MKDRTVCIVGAGVAGLSAAVNLKNSGFNVIVLEARNYTGGRVKFDHSLGIPFPMGAAFVHRDHEDLIYHLLQKYNPVLYDFSKATIEVFDDSNNKFTNSQLKTSKNYFEQILQKSNRAMKESEKDIPLADSIEHLSEHTSNGTSEDELAWQQLYLSLFTGISATHLSAKNWDQMREITGDFMLISSYEPLINELSAGLNIIHNTIVERVDYTSDNVLVQTNNGDYIADKVLITVPLGVLQSNKISFTPALPEKKSKSIQNLRMSQLNKIGLLFPYQFWPKDSVLIGYNATSNAIPIFLNYAYFFDKPILLGGVSGDTAIQLEHAGSDAFVEQAMNTLRQIYGNDIPEPISTITTSWISDPFSLGSYSYISVGASGEDYDAIAEPLDDKLFFAGEATYRDCHSTVQGAYLSGLREAKRICELFNL